MTAIAITVLAFVGVLGALPILAIAGARSSPPGCRAVTDADDDGTSSILGPATLAMADLRSWWRQTGRGQPPRLAIDIADLIDVYLSEADAEGVRGDLAFAQAIAETGYFTNSDTSINNFAGIAHYDGTPSGKDFPSPVVGVRAHIQLLKKYAAGNDTALAHADVSPNAGATATTWGGLSGTWASSPTYWLLLEDIYTSMVAHAQRTTDDIAELSGSPGDCPAGDLAVSPDFGGSRAS